MSQIASPAPSTPTGIFNRLANPTYFLKFSGKVLRVLVPATVVLFAVGLFLGLFNSPPDYQQKETVRIMYIHVPAAWLAMMGYAMIAVSSIGSLVWRHPLADVSAKCLAVVGAAFTLQALITGSLWGRPTWGSYWEWDGRMTSVLLLFFLYLGLIALWNAIEEPSRAGRAAAILGIVGSINLPIIHFSVVWFRTLHQGTSVVRMDGPSIHTEILWPLLIMTAAFTCLFFVVYLMAMRNEILRRRVASLRIAEVERASRAEPATVT